MPTTEFAVEIQQDFLERQAKATPVAAVAELIWNGLDADATSIEVDLEPDGFGGIGKIVVSDNGEGIAYDDAPALFGKLGGSWKKHGSRTKRLQRVLHGQEGRGRFKAFSLGAAVDWKIVHRTNGRTFAYDISILESDIRRVRISEQRPFDGMPGVAVVVSELKRNFTSLRRENSVQELSEIFAIYLKNYRDVRIRIAGEAIDPASAIEDSWDEMLSPITDEQGAEHSVSLEIIEWRRLTKRALYLCNEHVADRLKFLHGLNIILFDYVTKDRLKERTQLHKILEQNTWIFGEEYNLWASDKGLTRVLQTHKERLDPNIVIDEPVKIVSKTRGIVDLMLSRVQRRHRHDDIEHLVIVSIQEEVESEESVVILCPLLGFVWGRRHVDDGKPWSV